MTISDTAWLFIISCIGFGFIPGPAMLQTVSLTLQHGRKAGLLAALGILLGDMVQVSAVALGAAALLKTSPTAFQFIKVAGSLYLIWLGVQRLRTPLHLSASPVLERHGLWSSALSQSIESSPLPWQNH